MTAQTITQSKNDQHNLTDGPAKRDLFLALELRHEGRTIIFQDNSWRYIAKIDMIQAEDGSGESWNLKGSTIIEPVGMPRGCGPEKPIRYHFIGYFRTDRRKGHLIFV